MTPTPQEAPLLVKPTEAARLVGVSRAVMYRLLATGAVRSVVVGSRLRVPRAELERLADEGAPTATSSA